MFSSLPSDLLELIRWYILGAYVVATIGVILGVGLENGAFKKRTQHIGWLLLLLSLGIETYLTILFFFGQI